MDTQASRAVALVVARETDTREYEPMIRPLRAAGYRVVVVAPDLASLEAICLAGDCPVAEGFDVAAGRGIAFEAIVIPDGHGVDAFLHNDAALNWIANVLDAGRPVVALGRGQLLLAAADGLEERHVAAPEELAAEVEAVGGIVSLAPLHKEGPGGALITAHGRGQLDAVTEALVCALSDRWIDVEPAPRRRA